MWRYFEAFLGQTQMLHVGPIRELANSFVNLKVCGVRVCVCVVCVCVLCVCTTYVCRDSRFTVTSRCSEDKL